ncbi:hypothetical protein Ahy_B04g070410 isoform E [Arachis hypogaea]|uniref:Uncharacterized protein n=1 Tax=Arachis hypogaea TaxID=3818 RepID=A0A444ZGS2_ARAHY|nr:hypothetical protein Ahy_B04g070410 isoform E [Arachis hypogaea]
MQRVLGPRGSKKKGKRTSSFHLGLEEGLVLDWSWPNELWALLWVC